MIFGENGKYTQTKWGNQGQTFRNSIYIDFRIKIPGPKRVSVVPIISKPHAE